MKKRRRIGLRKSFSDAVSADRGGGAEGVTFFMTIWYWIVGVPVADDDEKLPALDPEFIEIVSFMPVKQADASFDAWLKMNSFSPAQITPDLRIDDGRRGDSDVRRYSIRRGSPGDRTA